MRKGKIVIGGDIFPRNGLDLFEQGRIDILFSKEIIDLFAKADLSICNLEGALTNSESKLPKCGPSIKAPPETVAGIKKLGVDCLALANNHVTDYGSEGYGETCRTLSKCGISYFGAGPNINNIQTNYRKTINDKTVIFYAVGETVFNIPSADSAGINLYDEYRVCNELKELKKQCDCLIVLYHGGVEYFQFPTPWIRTRFHRMADNGADIIIAQHTHCIGTQENYNGSYLLYGQGNFHFIQNNKKDVTQTGLLMEIDLGDNGFDIRPHLIHRNGDMAQYDDRQDLSDFFERSQRLEDGDTFEKEFSVYSEEWMLKWLLEFRGLTLKDKIMKKILSPEKFYNYMRKDYSDFTVLRMLEHVRGEEDVEVMQKGLSDFYGRNRKG